MKENKNSLAFWLFVAPTLIALSTVVFIPALMGVYYSFTDWNGIVEPKFIGISNYLLIFKDQLFLKAIWFTAKFAVVAVVVLNATGLGLALLVTSKLRGSNLLRTVFFMPNLIGGLILGFIWQFIFLKVFASVGDLTGILSLKTWLATPITSFWGLVILMVWQTSGYIMIIYIAYIQAIPGEVVEAAHLDGVSPWQKFRYITFPLIAPGFTVNMFLTLANCFKLYDQNLSLTGGGPYQSTQMVAMEIYDTAFARNQMAYAQAKALVFLLLIAIISVIQVSITKKREVEL